MVADPRNDPRWCRAVKSVDMVEERRWRVMHKPIPLRPPRELELKQLEAEPPHRLALRWEDAAAIFNIEYRLEPIQDGTRFTQVSVFAWKRLPRVFHGTFRRAVRREVRRQLRTLRALLEREGPHHSPVAEPHERHGESLAKVRRAVFEGQGSSDRATRDAAAIRGDFPEPLASYLAKVRDASYRVTDADIVTLKSWLSEEEIFELTVAATLGRALRSLDAGLGAMRELP